MSRPVPARPHPAALQAPLPLWAAVLLAGAAGPFLDAAFPDRGWWPFAFLGDRDGARRGRGAQRRLRRLLVGLVFGATFYFPHIEWASLYLGPIPWSALSALMALWCAPRHRPDRGRLPAGCLGRCPGCSRRCCSCPLVVAGLWIAREAAASVWPYGGFAWGRVVGVAVGQPDRSAVRLARRLRRGIRDGVPGRGRAGSDPGEPGTRSMRGRCWSTALADPARRVPGAGRRSTEGTLRVGAVQGNARGRLLRRPPVRREPARPVPGDRARSTTRTSTSCSGRRAHPTSTRCATRPPPRSGTRCPSAPDAPLVAGTVTTRDGSLLQHVDPLARGRGDGRLLRQTAPHPVRRVRARPGVLAPVRARADRPHPARLRAGHHGHGHGCRPRRAIGARRHRHLLRHRRRPGHERGGATTEPR